MTKKVVRNNMQKKKKKLLHKKPHVKKYKKKKEYKKRRGWKRYYYDSNIDAEAEMLGAPSRSEGSPMVEPRESGKIAPERSEYDPYEYQKKHTKIKEKDEVVNEEPKKGWWERRKEQVGKAYGGDFRKKWFSKYGAKGTTFGVGKRGVKYTGLGITLGGAGLKSIAGKASETMKQSIGPIQIFQMAWSRTTGVIKFGIALVFLLALFFVPIGIFYYTGWAVGAAIMFLISLIYWVFINIFNGIAYVIISALNGIITIMIQVIITLVETVLGWLRGSGTWLVVPNPIWAAQYSRSTGNDPWGAKVFADAQASINEQIKLLTSKTSNDIAAIVNTQAYARYVPPSYWYEGHLLIENTLIRYDQIANIPVLMLISRPEWQPAYNETIVSAILRLFGLSDIADAFKNAIYNIGYTKAFQGFATNSEPWLVVLVGLLPLITIALIVYYIYRKNKSEIGMTWPWNAA